MIPPFGLRSSDIEKITEVFSKYPDVQKVILYGSRAKGNYKNGSDIDLTMVGDSLDLTIQFKIENDLDDLLLPYGIDLSIFSKISNTDLVDHINRVGKVFYTKKSIVA
jgi:type I restriction enzyme S subunit